MAIAKPTRQAVELRELADGDFQEVLALYRTVFGSAYAARFAHRWTWAHKENVIPNRSLKWVLVSDQRVVGFLAAIPQWYSLGRDRVIAHTPCDFMVHPDYRFHGIQLMTEFFNSCPNCVTCDDIPATIGITKWLGAQPVSPVVTYVKVLDARALRFGREVPGVLYGVGSYVLEGIDRVLLSKPSGVRLTPLSDFDHRFQELYEETSRTVPAMVAKDGPFLGWRYGQSSPHGSREIVTATTPNGELLGYVVLYLAMTPRPSGYVLDLQVLPDRSNDIDQALLACAAERFRELGALTMKYHRVPSPFVPSRGLLAQLGFIARNRVNRLLMVKFAEPDLARVASESGNWRYSFGDLEVSHSLA